VWQDRPTVPSEYDKNAVLSSFRYPPTAPPLRLCERDPAAIANEAELKDVLGKLDPKYAHETSAS